jgi:UDP-glucose 4-epimerase
VRYLVTGGAGFVGSHLVDALVERGDQAVVLDNFSTGRAENLEHLDGGLKVVRGSVLDRQLVMELMSEVDATFHLASAVGVRRIVRWPLESLLENVRGMDVMTSSAVELGHRLLVASTSEVYGKQQAVLHEGSDRVYGSRARWGYATAKAVGEQMVYGYSREQGAEMMAVRLFNVTGPRQYDMVIPQMVGRALEGEDVTVFGDGAQRRCFIHVADTVRALLALIEEDVAIGGVYNVGDPSEEISMLQLARRVIRLTESKSGIVLAPPDYGEGFEEIRRRRPNITAIMDLVDWTPELTLNDAIQDVIAYQSGAAEWQHARSLSQSRS